jgi:regulator of protease activity HflC (stomatin/prohibitin superfamily)
MVYIIASLLFLATLLICFSSLYLVQQAQTILIERLGKYDRILSPGLHLTIPFVENPRSVTWSFLMRDGQRYVRYLRTFYKIDLRESVYDFPKQNVITKDNVTMEINALLYYQITNPKAAIYAVSNLPEAIEKLTQTTLRNVIGSMDLDETLVSRDQINEKLRIILDEATDKRGVKVNRVELQEVNPPEDIRIAMEKQMRAERDKRAAILEAEGLKQATILKAEGQADARLKVAEAEAKAIEYVSRVMPDKDPLPYLVAMQYMKVLPKMVQGKDNKLVIVPYDAASLSSSVAMVKKIFKDIK